MNDIVNYETFTKIEPINKGWSSDKKYYVETISGEKRLVRIADISEYKDKHREFDIMKRISATGVNMSQPIDFGVCCEGKNVYQLLTWCEGEEAKEVLFNLSEAEQYAFGQKAGQILKTTEKIDSNPPSHEWAGTYKKRVEKYIELYRNCGATFNGDDVIISYLKNHHDCIGERPTSLMHEDFQTDNMVISPDMELYVIDFQQCGIVDPYYAMMSVGVSAEFSVSFAMGQMDSYFGGEVPDDFWEKHTYYMLTEMLYAFTVAITLGEEEIEYSKHMFDKPLSWLGSGDMHIPDWYLQNKEPLD